MGCSSSDNDNVDNTPDECSHHIAGKKSDQSNVDYSKNPNQYIVNCQNYWQGVKPEAKKPFEDKSFPSNNQSLNGSIKYNKYGFEKSAVEWVSYKEIWGADASLWGKNNKVTIEDIKIGKVKDAYVIAALSSLGEFPKSIVQLFKTVKIPEDGSPVEVALKIEGKWVIVPLDDKFPAIKESKSGEKAKYTPVFGNAQNGALWGVYLEKAWAKINGSYGNIESGYPREVFQVLTPFTTIPIDVAKENPENLWKNLVSSNDWDCIMTCSISTKIDEESLKKVGLVPNLSFSLIDAFERQDKDGNVYKLVKIRNPIGEGEWNGKYSDKSDAWTDDLKKLFEFTGEAKDDGIFWMEYNDFKKYFEVISICVPVIPLKLTSLKIPKENAAYFNVIRIKIPDDGTILSISVDQQNPRFHRDSKDIKPDQQMIENLMLAKVGKDSNGKPTVEVIDSAYNETMSTACEAGEYLAIFQLDFASGDGYTPAEYNLTMSSDSKFQYEYLEPDKELKLVKMCMLSKLEKMDKYKKKFGQNNLVIFCGNRFEATALGFMYIKNEFPEVKYVRPKPILKNYKSIEGNYPSCLKMEPNDKWFFLIDRTKAAEKFQTGISCKHDSIPDNSAVKPIQINKIPECYTRPGQYKDSVPEFEYDG